MKGYTKPIPVPVPFMWDGLADQRACSNNGDSWLVQDLVNLAAALPVFDLPMALIDLSGLKLAAEDVYAFASQYKQVEKCELKYPIIMSHKGEILDGSHRIVKALVLGKKTIKCKRFVSELKPLAD